jgi:hypothetical protein
MHKKVPLFEQTHMSDTVLFCSYEYILKIDNCFLHYVTGLNLLRSASYMELLRISGDNIQLMNSTEPASSYS